MKMANLCSSPRSVLFFCCCILLITLLLFLLFMVSPSSSSSSSSNNNNENGIRGDHDDDEEKKVTMSVYYESMCPYCADFIVNHLVRIFQIGLFSILNLRMIPWGNAFIKSDGSFLCQHGNDECFLNTIEACTIRIYPDVIKHFRFIHCVERLTLQGQHEKWANCFQMSGLDTSPLDCYSNGNGKSIEEDYATETAHLNPPIRFVPWVVVNNQALQEDYENFVAYICKAFKGNPKPDACMSLSTSTSNNDSNYNSKYSFLPVCYANHSLSLN